MFFYLHTMVFMKIYKVFIFLTWYPLHVVIIHVGHMVRPLILTFIIIRIRILFLNLNVIAEPIIRLFFWELSRIIFNFGFDDRTHLLIWKIRLSIYIFLFLLIIIWYLFFFFFRLHSLLANILIIETAFLNRFYSSNLFYLVKLFNLFLVFWYYHLRTANKFHLYDISADFHFFWMHFNKTQSFFLCQLYLLIKYEGLFLCGILRKLVDLCF